MIESNYQIARGEHDSFVITETGRCDGDATTVATIMEGCCRRFSLEIIPQSRGVILKPMDGTSPAIVDIKPPTIGRTFQCVKVDGYVNPFAPTQPGGVYNGKTVLAFVRVWQQVGTPP